MLIEAHEPQVLGFMQTTIKQQSPEGHGVVSEELAAVVAERGVPTWAR